MSYSNRDISETCYWRLTYNYLFISTSCLPKAGIVALKIALSKWRGPINLQCGEPIIAPTASLAAFVYFSPIKAFKCERQRPCWRATLLCS